MTLLNKLIIYTCSATESPCLYETGCRMNTRVYETHGEQIPICKWWHSKAATLKLTDHKLKVTLKLMQLHSVWMITSTISVSGPTTPYGQFLVLTECYSSLFEETKASHVVYKYTWVVLTSWNISWKNSWKRSQCGN